MSSTLKYTLLKFAVQKKIHTHPERSLEIPRGKGVLKAKILEAKYEDKLEFLGGRGVCKQKTYHGGVQLFSGTSQFNVHYTCMVIIIIVNNNNNNHNK